MDYSGIDLSGLSGFALEAAKALKGGSSYDDAISTATKKIGGSGLTVSDGLKIVSGGASSSSVEIDDNGYIRAAGSGSSSNSGSAGKNKVLYEPQISEEGYTKNTGGVIKSTNQTAYDEAYTPFAIPSNPADISVSKSAVGDFSNYLVFGVIVLLVIKVFNRGQGRR